MHAHQWNYKGHECSIELQTEYDADGPENQKAWHHVTTPDGKVLTAGISPYETNPRAVELWIDLGCPPAPPSYNFTLDDLQAMHELRINDLLKCNQKGCFHLAAYRFTWPGQDEAGICEQHSAQLRSIAEGMGLHLQLIPI